jgi:urease accessory protein
MGWHGTLALRYRSQNARTVVHDRHDGPLRVLKMLHPEGDSVCHSVLVHPPGGIVGGDRLAIEIEVEPGAHALLTTPGATRFYRSAGQAASQSVAVRVAAGSRFEWLPLETIAFSGCIAENRARFELAPGAEMMGWDVTALGLPASSQPFVTGRFTQTIEIPGRWLERGTMRGDGDARLLESPLGWAARPVLATLWFAAGSALAEARRDALLDAARETMRGHPLAATAGCSAAQAEVVLVRALAPQVEAVTDLLMRIWSVWRPMAWNRAPCPPRVWQT